MNHRERFVQCGLNQNTDRGVFWEDRFWPETVERWKKEGMPENYDFGFDFPENDSMNALGIHIGYHPKFIPEVLKDEENTRVIRDEYGIVKRVKKYESGMPQFLSFPVHDRKSWEELKPRLDPESEGRFPENWEERIKLANAQDRFPVTFGGSHLCGFFSLLRELCGDECYYLFYDEPELVRDIVAFQEYRLTSFVKRASGDANIDRQFIWEDMCFNKGPLISPQLFRDFLLEPYQRTIAAAKSCGVRIIDLDSDGKIDELVPLWLEAGVDMLHPFEVAAGMDVYEVKKQYGSRLAMRGGVDKRAISMDFAAIDREMERIRPAFEMGGYIPSFDHAVPPTVSWDNYRYYLDRLCRMLGK